MRCDFCLQPDPFERKRYQARIQIISQPFTDADCMWSACEECSVLIDAGKWPELVERAAIGNAALGEDRAFTQDRLRNSKATRNAARFLYRGFRTCGATMSEKVQALFDHARQELDSSIGSVRRARLQMRIARVIRRAVSSIARDDREVFVGLYTAALMHAMAYQKNFLLVQKIKRPKSKLKIRRGK